METEIPKIKKVKNLIQVFEYQRVTLDGKRYPLPISESCGGKFDDDLFKSFEAYHQKNDNTPFFKLIRNGVQFGSYVGAIRIGKTTVEVLPKADRTNNNEKDNVKEKWQGVLLDMLKTCHLLKAKQSGEANLKLKANSVFELYFELFVNEVEQLIRQGLIKKYRKKEGNRTALKGALVFSKHISKNIVHKEKFYVKYTDYNKNHIEHQILFEALLGIQQLNSSSLLSDRIGRIMLDFPIVNRIKVNENTFSTLVENRKTAPYKLALDIAELILLNYRPDIKSGSRNLLAIMFDMNILWEEYVYRVMKKFPNEGCRVERQQSKNFWNNITARPDVVIRKGEDTFIIDTKWKLVDSNKPSIDDLRQIFAYNHLWKSTNSLLLYPGDESKGGNKFIDYTPSEFAEKKDKHGCKVGFINVLDFHNESDKTKKDFANSIFNQLVV
jgi:5-methylcytosine-specific restriction enzyme subunit McrC